MLKVTKRDSKEHQEYVLGTILMDGPTPNVVEILSKLKKEMFSDERAIIFEKCRMLFDEQGETNLGSVMEYFLNSNYNVDVVSSSAIAIATNHYGSGNVRYHAKRIRQIYNLNNTMVKALRIVNDISREGDIGKATRAIEDVLSDLVIETDDTHPVLLKDIAGGYLERLDNRIENPKASGLETGCRVIDENVGPFNFTDLITIAGAPGFGKTEFALMMLKNIAEHNNKHVVIFTLEMDRFQIYQRFAAIHTGISNGALRNPMYLKEEDFPKITEAISNINNLPIYVDDSPSLTLWQVISKAKMMKQRHPDIACIAIDYIQNLDFPTDVPRHLSVNEATKKLKALAKEIHCPIIQVAQINRNWRNRRFKEPNNQDLADSSGIERDSNVILFPYRPDEAGDENTCGTLAKIIVGKNRDKEKTPFVMDFVNGHFLETDKKWVDKKGVDNGNVDPNLYRNSKGRDVYF